MLQTHAAHHFMNAVHMPRLWPPATSRLRSTLSHRLGLAAVWLLCGLLTACNNSPYPIDLASQNILFNSTQERSPRYLDPTASYNNNETPYTYQIMEPLYGYHYLKRPYTLEPKLATEVALPKYFDKAGQPLPADAPAESIALSVYDIHLAKGVKYQPHPAFATDDKGRHVYHDMKPGELGARYSPWDFDKTGTRELVADDFVYALKRHATTRIEAPIFAIFAEYVVGLAEYGELIKKEDAKLRAGLDPASLDKPFLDFRRWPLEGVEAVDSHTVRMKIKGKYPQWKYWLAMTFMAPVPWEVDKFYAQPGMLANGLAWTKWPVGTGPYMMTEYLQDRRHVMRRNPNYRGSAYPCEGMPGDKEAGRLDDCGKTMPFIDEIVTTVEKEAVAQKAKFVQGYLDVPEIERSENGVTFRAEMADSDDAARMYNERGLQFPQNVDLSNWYLGFNWLDPVVGKGDTPEQQVRNRKLRQALSIAIDWEEGYGKIFVRKAGEAAHGPLPAGLFGSRHGTIEGHNPVTHKVVDGKVVRRSIDEAKKLLAEAGYPDGRDAKSGRPLVLNYDYQRAPSPELKAELDWMVRQFNKIGVQLEIRATDYNQFNEKVLAGKQQIFWWGWLADYPDPENFLFLLYGPNSKAKVQGENTANYENPEYDRLYKLMQTMDDGPEKQKVIDQMIAVAREDAPWSWGYFPYAAGAYAAWLHNGKPSIMVRDQARYYRIDPAVRAERLAQWNHPIYWPMALIGAALLALLWVARRSWRRHERSNALGQVLDAPARPA